MANNYYKTKELNYILKILAPELGLTFTSEITDKMEAISLLYAHGEIVAQSDCSSIGLQDLGIQIIYNVLKTKKLENER